jgi:hypothetical protein
VDEAVPLAETLQRIRQRHAETVSGNAPEVDSSTGSLCFVRRCHVLQPILGDERLKIARVANAVNVLRSTHSMVSAESIQRIYSRSIELGMAPKVSVCSCCCYNIAPGTSVMTPFKRANRQLQDMLRSDSILRLMEA